MNSTFPSNLDLAKIKTRLTGGLNKWIREWAEDAYNVRQHQSISRLTREEHAIQFGRRMLFYFQNPTAHRFTYALLASQHQSRNRNFRFYMALTCLLASVSHPSDVAFPLSPSFIKFLQENEFLPKATAEKFGSVHLDQNHVLALDYIPKDETNDILKEEIEELRKIDYHQFGNIGISNAVNLDANESRILYRMRELIRAMDVDTTKNIDSPLDNDLIPTNGLFWFNVLLSMYPGKWLGFCLEDDMPEGMKKEQGYCPLPTYSEREYIKHTDLTDFVAVPPNHYTTVEQIAEDICNWMINRGIRRSCNPMWDMILQTVIKQPQYQYGALMDQYVPVLVNQILQQWKTLGEEYSNYTNDNNDSRKVVRRVGQCFLELQKYFESNKNNVFDLFELTEKSIDYYINNGSSSSSSSSFRANMQKHEENIRYMLTSVAKVDLFDLDEYTVSTIIKCIVIAFFEAFDTDIVTCQSKQSIMGWHDILTFYERNEHNILYPLFQSCAKLLKTGIQRDMYNWCADQSTTSTSTLSMEACRAAADTLTTAHVEKQDPSSSSTTNKRKGKKQSVELKPRYTESTLEQEYNHLLRFLLLWKQFSNAIMLHHNSKQAIQVDTFGKRGMIELREQANNLKQLRQNKKKDKNYKHIPDKIKLDWMKNIHQRYNRTENNYSTQEYQQNTESDAKRELIKSEAEEQEKFRNDFWKKDRKREFWLLGTNDMKLPHEGISADSNVRRAFFTEFPHLWEKRWAEILKLNTNVFIPDLFVENNN